MTKVGHDKCHCIVTYTLSPPSFYNSAFLLIYIAQMLPLWEKVTNIVDLNWVCRIVGQNSGTPVDTTGDIKV